MGLTREYSLSLSLFLYLFPSHTHTYAHTFAFSLAPNLRFRIPFSSARSFHLIPLSVFLSFPVPSLQQRDTQKTSARGAHPSPRFPLG